MTHSHLNKHMFLKVFQNSNIIFNFEPYGVFNVVHNICNGIQIFISPCNFVSLSNDLRHQQELKHYF